MARVLPHAVVVSDRLDRSAAGHAHRIEQEVLEYLRENPGAMDSIEGIAAWWLPRHEVRVGVELVARALERLEMDGLIERTGDPDRPLYRLRQVAQLRGTEGQDFRGLR